MRMRFRFLVAPLTAALACSSSSNEDPPDQPPMVEPVEDGCPALFAQDVVPDFHVDIGDEEWAALEYDLLHRDERIAAGQDPSPYHPAVFRHDGDVVEDAMIRLKGASSWAETVAFDDDPKMQFVISFNEKNEDGRYKGARKLSLDMPRTDGTFLRQRLGLYAMRSKGIMAQCANNARLFINDASYGVDQSSFSVPPLGNALLFASFNPASVGPHPATMTIHSDDPDSPAKTVPLSGTGLVAPDIDPSPDAVVDLTGKADVDGFLAGLWAE